jgi:phosphoglycolate phosphatase-like HAD superfamily hydrolase
MTNPVNDSNWLVMLNPSLPQRLGRIRQVLFDFDGTLSLLRQGWEDIMAPMMLEMITPHAPAPAEIEHQVREYIDQSTGVLTIHQMEWLAQAVRQFGLAPQPLSAAEYKAVYVQRIRGKVQQRTQALHAGTAAPGDFLLAGAQAFLDRFARRGLTLYLASGTDHADVVAEARLLNLEEYFQGGIHGALDASEAHDKERLIQRILVQNHLQGDELLVVGDGPVEIRVAVAQGAVALGVASDEVARSGWNERKVRRLTQAGADLLIPDFSRAGELEQVLLGQEKYSP